MAEPKFDELDFYKQEKLCQISHRPPDKGWMDTEVDFREEPDDNPAAGKPGNWIYPGKAKNLKVVSMPNPRDWSPAGTEKDWQLPDNWQQIILEGFKDRLERFRSLRVFMDICVRCGACADKCHFFLGGGDPKNMPVLRAELLRSVYRNDFTTAGKLLGRMVGARKLTFEVLKEWFYYFFQCTECRRCSVFCPYGIDTAEITMLARELLNLVGINVNWIMEPVANCFITGNHLRIQPHGMKDTLEFFCDDIEEVTGIKIDPPINDKKADILFVTPSGDLLADPGTYTCMGYMMLFHELGLNYTWSTYASDGGNFGLFTSNEAMKRLNRKIYAEAERLGVKWILGGECGHMWRVVNQYMDTMNGPANWKEAEDVPTSPITGTKFYNARTTKMVHITEFTADLLKHNKLKLDKSKNDYVRPTFHDSCNPARAMGIFEEPRYVIQQVCNNFFEMPRNTIREMTYCCGGGAGLGTDENMEQRLRGGYPRSNAVRYVNEKHDVNHLVAMCAIDRATLSTICEFWTPEVRVSGIHELVANALIMKGQTERTQNLRLEEYEDLMGGEDE